MSNIELLRDYRLKNREVRGIQITRNGKIIEITHEMLKPYIEYITEYLEKLRTFGWTEEDTKEFLRRYKEFSVADLYIALKTIFKDVELKDEYELEKLKTLSVWTVAELKERGFLR